ncbi:VTT domain-containing protein [Granulicella mallensis]|uniref:SNARE associated Golgi protein-like protein n=1 Tax=Granulicella mallensis (strain ATCC BAA-1857 / DSM 23137 / MP5ACTX8) TaxID=682795 RepID=G8NUL0_GRAMM|nr:VTT domain-containing protein [Granulicella mallensis]AEU36461.1 SNARE associated Golgi protein-like protein [Granulicella mallensis MP5ACTX8]
MTWMMGLLLRHTYSVIFGWVFVEQAGLPIPSIPLMLAAGTMSAAHKVHVAYALPVVMLACLIADSMWYFLGKRYGTKVLDLLCRFSLEAATCVSRTQGSVTKRGAFTLLFAKFVPGLSTMAAPIVGQAKIPYPTFVIYDMAGTLIWASVWLFAGRFFGDLAKRSSDFFAALGHFAGLLVVLMVIGVVVYRLVKRRQFVTELRGLRLEPTQLLAMIDDAKREGKELPFIVDLRHPLDLLPDPRVLPGALRIGPDQLKERSMMIPRDRDIVLYCTCPSEETSAKVAMELRRMGVRRVRPLRGGLQGWKDAGFPLEIIELV